MGKGVSLAVFCNNPRAGMVESGDVKNIALWMLDKRYFPDIA